MIQFATGLEWAPTTATSSTNALQSRQMIAIGYGIMDCESSVVYVNRNVVESMLRNVLVDDASVHNIVSTTLVGDTLEINQEWDLDIETFTKMSETMDNMS